MTSVGQSAHAASSLASSLIRTADADHDKRIGIDEFVGYIQLEAKTFNTEKTLLNLESVVLGDHYIVARAISVFRKLDLDGDGRLTPSELMALLEATGEPEENAWAKTKAFLGVADKNANKV